MAHTLREKVSVRASQGNCLRDEVGFDCFGVSTSRVIGACRVPAGKHHGDEDMWYNNGSNADSDIPKLRTINHQT